MIDASDQELIERTVAKRDQRAYSTLVLRYQSPIRSALRQWATDMDHADDLAQECFIKAFQALSTFRGEASFKTWLYRIAYNIAMSDRRKRGLLLLDDLNHAEQYQTEDSEHHHPELKEDLQRAMTQLSMAQQTLVDLCLRRGFSHQEAADITGMALGTVKSHVNRGKAKLAEILAAWREEAHYA